MSADYRATVFLPRTEFPMKGQLPEREPRLLQRWETMDLYGRLREQAKGRPKFILHDGPPYANGHLHIGHALNKILKDVINRSQQMLGRDAAYVPGWDCHGLPIEWQVEQNYRKAGKDKDAVPPVQFRRECRAYAEKWVAVQREEFKRLGVVGDWDHAYTTMSFAAEAQIVREIGKFLVAGALYKGAKPVLWSVVEKTALAEAEVEYEDHESTTIWVRFPIVKPGDPALKGASVVIWTTTPWTIPGNRAIAYGEAFRYSVIRAIRVTDHRTVTPERESVAKKMGVAIQDYMKNIEPRYPRVNDILVVASDLLGAFCPRAGIDEYELLAEISGSDLRGTVCAHPLRGADGAGGYYDFDVPLHAGDFVSAAEGTGFVHIAPSHGQDDYELGRRHGLPLPEMVDEEGRFYPHVPLFAGKRVLTSTGKRGEANGAVVEALKAAGALLAQGRLVHAYPHSWRSKAPLIFRNTPQWFISMEAGGLRAKALAAIDAVRWVPPASKARIRGMIETRPDWVVSRQRVWGVPIAIFVHKESGEPLREAEVVERVAEAVAREGADVWFDADPAPLLGPGRDPADYEKVTDILDVWFDSGSTHAFVLETRPDLAWPASLYVEGSDQHRGWFHSSLLESCGTRGRAPYEAVLTHGFVVDGEGRKMSKSLGNVVAPQEVVSKYGADILRLWVVSADYSEDMRISEAILGYQVDAYRRLRNTLRYILGNLADFSDDERVPREAMPELERWVLHRLAELDSVVRRACADFDFHALFVELHNFCAVDLSAFYFDVRKDSLYCDPRDALRRRAARTVLDTLFDCLTAWLAPIVPFTAEEAHLTRGRDNEGSVHLRLFPAIPTGWRDDVLARRWKTVRAVRRVVTGALEVERREKRIGSSLEAAPEVHVTPAQRQVLDGLDFAEICITSGLRLIEGAPPEGAYRLDEVAGAGVVARRAPGRKCARCWRVLEEVGARRERLDLCARCAAALPPGFAASG